MSSLFFFFADCAHTQTQNLETYHDLTSVLNMYIFLLIKLIASTSCPMRSRVLPFCGHLPGKENLVLRVDRMYLHSS